MSRAIAKVGVVARADFAVYDAADAPVTGLVTGDFTRLLSKNGVDDATAVTVAEVGSGRYEATFTPGSAGYWHLLLRHATHNPRGWQEGFDVTADGLLSKADVNAEVVDVLNTDAGTELGSVPAKDAPIRQQLQMLFQALRNEVTVTGSAKTIANDAGTAIATKALSDDGTTYAEAKAS